VPDEVADVGRRACRRRRDGGEGGWRFCSLGREREKEGKEV